MPEGAELEYILGLIPLTFILPNLGLLLLRLAQAEIWSWGDLNIPLTTDWLRGSPTKTRGNRAINRTTAERTNKPGKHRADEVDKSFKTFAISKLRLIYL